MAAPDPAPLSAHPLFATCDLDVARAEVARVFCAHDLRLTRPGGRLDAVHNSVRVGRIGLNYLRYGDAVRIDPGSLDGFYLVQIPLAGTAEVNVAGHAVHSDRLTASLPSPTDRLEMVWSDGCEQLLVYLAREAVDEHVAAATGRPQDRPLRFDPAVRLDAPAVRGWLRTVQLLRDDAEAGLALARSPLAAAHLEQLVVAGLVAGQPNNYTDAIRAGHGPAATRAVRRALGAIEDRPEEPWTAARLAAHAGVSIRSLQDGFHQHVGVAPSRHLRDVRLARVRAELLSTDGARGTVTEISLRWGFAHAGRFAAAYRRRYGETPSQTARGAAPRRD